MNKYEKYKDTGIEWIGKIPLDWKTPKLKHLITKSFGGEVIDKSYWGEGNETLYTTSKKIHKSNYPDFNDDRKTTENDLLLSRNGDGVVHIPPDGCIYTNVVQLVRIKDGINRRFLWYSLTSQIKPLNSSSDGDFIVSLNKEQWFNLLTPLPTTSEQKEIVSYLDTNILPIDSLIKKIQQKIELLKEQKISLISEIVTKGLNSDIEMKDCGVEWIGEIPKDWGFIKLKRLFFINKRISGELGFDVLSVTQNGLKVKDLENSMGQHSMDYTKYQLVYENDFVMNHMDLLTGYVDISKQTGVTSPDYRVFTKYNDTVFNNYYLYIFQLLYKQKVFYGLGRGVSNMGRWRLPSVEFLNMYLPLPPYSEQKQIVEYLNKQTQKIDTIICTEEKRIDLLKEYKQSLISEVVTGKKRVV